MMMMYDDTLARTSLLLIWAISPPLRARSWRSPNPSRVYPLVGEGQSGCPRCRGRVRSADRFVYRVCHCSCTARNLARGSSDLSAASPGLLQLSGPSPILSVDVGWMSGLPSVPRSSFAGHRSRVQASPMFLRDARAFRYACAALLHCLVYPPYTLHRHGLPPAPSSPSYPALRAPVSPRLRCPASDPRRLASATFLLHSLTVLWCCIACYRRPDHPGLVCPRSRYIYR